MKRYFIWGMGLLGASIALDLKRLGHYVSGCDKSEENKKTLNAKNFDKVFTLDEEKLWEDIMQADGIIIGTPIDHIFSILEELSNKNLPSHIWITDMASTKGDLMNWVNSLQKPLNFVGSHPMAGSDLNGPQHARENLFDNATIYITPSENQNQRLTPDIYNQTVQNVCSFWECIGSKPYIISHKDHDKWAAYLSHGLHLVSCMVSHLIYNIPEIFDMPTSPAAGSFRDITRVAGSNPLLWDGIIGSNSAEVTKYLESLESLVKTWRQQLSEGKLPVKEIFEKSAQVRKALIRDT